MWGGTLIPPTCFTPISRKLLVSCLSSGEVKNLLSPVVGWHSWHSGRFANQFPRCRGACCDAHSSGQIHPQSVQAQTTPMPRGCLKLRHCQWTEERYTCSHTRLHVKADKLKHESAEIVVPLLEDVIKVNHCWFLYLWSSPKKQRAFQHFSKPMAFDPYLPIGRKDLMTEGRWKKTLRLVKPESLQTQPPSVKHWQNGENIQMSSNVPTFLWKNKAFRH